MMNISKRGFSLVEVLISVSIVGVILATILFNYGTFNDQLAISAGAQEIAIILRQAQTYGLTVKEVEVGGGGFSSAYGVYLDFSTDSSNYYLFVDKDGDRKYDVGSGCGSGAATECITRFSLRNSVRISSICDKDNNCPPGTSQKLHVTFLRPNPDATIIFANSSDVTQSVSPLTGKIRLTSLKGSTATITIESTGQISVQ